MELDGNASALERRVATDVAEGAPTISIVTPSYNQAEFLEECITSVLEQGYQPLEYVIIDGGSTDGSVAIIQKYASQLTSWVSEPDGGQYDAINKGFRRTSGEIMAWLNSDDKYAPWAFSVVSEIFQKFPEVEWLTTLYPLKWDRRGQAVACRYTSGFNYPSFFNGANLPRRRWYARSWIQQESTFWRRSLWERVGGDVDTSLGLAADFELWARFFQFADLYAVATPLAGFRVHGSQKTAMHMEEYLTEAEDVIHRYGGRPYGPVETLVRRLTYYGIGGRPLERLPRPMGRLLTHMGILYPVKTCVWTGSDWRLVTDYVV